MKKTVFIFLLLLGLCLLAAVSAEEWQASPADGSLMRALEMCADGDAIVLSGGVYDIPRENFPLVIGKRITLRAAEGETPVIDAPQLQSAIRIEADGVTLPQVLGLVWIL